MHGRTCIVTGASSGIGRAAATGLAERGAHVVIVCRDRGRGEAARDHIRATTGNAAVDLELADLASLDSVRTLAARLLERYPAVHVLLNNAGIVNTSRHLTVDGIEEVFAVNHLAPFLLTNLLLDRLRASAPARIVNVASDAHRFGSIDFDDLMFERSFRTFRVYGASKRANILFTYELARRIDGSGVTANCLHPGAVGTSLAAQNGAVARAIIGLIRRFLRTPEKGAETAIHLAASPDVEAVNGEYFSDCRPRRSDAATYDRETQRRLWDASAELCSAAASR